jgi:hypothetical protein
MAQAADQHNWSLTDYHRYVRITLGCGINIALCEMERRIVSGQLLLIPNGGAVEINRFDFLSNYTLQLDGHDRVQVVTQRPALLPGGITYLKFDPFDRKSLVRIGPGRAMDGYYTVIERPPRPPASQTAPEGRQVSRVKQALKELFPPDGRPPDDMLLKTVGNHVNKIFEERRWKPASLDSLARAMGRRRA